VADTTKVLDDAMSDPAMGEIIWRIGAVQPTVREFFCVVKVLRDPQVAICQ
jgi:hypothetical protein